MRWRILWLTLSLGVACGLIGITFPSLEADEPKEAQKPAEKTDKAEKPKEEAKPPAVNPLQDLFQKLMPPKVDPQNQSHHSRGSTSISIREVPVRMVSRSIRMRGIRSTGEQPRIASRRNCSAKRARRRMLRTGKRRWN